MKKLLKKYVMLYELLQYLLIGGVVWLVQKSVEAMLGRKYLMPSGDIV